MSKQKFVGRGDLAIRPDSVGLTWPRAPGEREYNSSVCRDGVAVIKICGPLEHHGGMWFESYEQILNRVEGAMLDEDVHAVILDIDSPGGEVSGLQETVRRIRAMREEHSKPVIAYADDEAYSAAYALACAADEIYIPDSGGVGSVGVLAEVCDRTEMTKEMGLRIEVVRSGNRKADGHPDIPLSDATIARVQARVDGLAKQFFALVSDVRPVSRADLEALEGACVYGKKAVAAGLADGIASFEEVFAAYAKESFDNARSSPVSFNPTDRSVGLGDNAMAFEVLKKKVAAAAAALEAAKTLTAKKKAMAAYAAAAEALAEARAKSKVKKSYKKKTVEEEEETDDGEADEGDDDGDGDGNDDDDESSEAAASADEDSDEDAEEEDEDAEEEKKMKKGKKAAAGGSLLSFVRSLTGQSSARAAKQVLASMHEQANSASEAIDRVSRLEAAATEAKRDALISAMMTAGQLKPSQLDWAKGQTLRSLKSFSKATPAIFAPRPAPMHGPHEEASEAPDTDGLTSFERALCTEQGISIESYKKTRDAKAPGANAPKVN